MLAVSRASIATTATNTAVAFTLIGLVTTVVFLITNAALVFTTIKNIKPPDIKQVVIKGLDNGPVRLYLDLEFPGTSHGSLISAQTEGPLKVSVFVTERGKKSSEKPSISAVISSAINLNLASNEATRLIIDDLNIKLDESFDSGIFSRIIAAKMDNNFKPEMLPNVSIRIDTRVVFKSLWIPLGASLNIPIEIDLADMMKKVAEKEKKNVNVVLSASKIEKQKIIKEFNFKPRLVQVAASDSDKLEVHAILAIPAAIVPDFLTVEIPEVKFQANFYELTAEAEKNAPLKFVQVGIEQFVLEPAPMDNLKAEINFKASLTINKNDIEGVRKILELFREEKKYEIGIQVKPSEEFIATKNAGGLLYWLRDFIFEVPVKEILMKMDEAKKVKDDKVLKTDKLEVKEEIKDEKDTNAKETSDTRVITAEASKENMQQKTIVSAKFLKAEKTLQGGQFFFQIKILHSVVDFLVGSLPVIDFQIALDDGTKLLVVRIYSNEIIKESPTIEINIALEINNLKQAVYAGLLLTKMGTEEMHKKLPEVRAIKGLKVEFISDNVISKMARAFNLNVLFGGKGIESVKFQNSDYILFPKPEPKKKDSIKDTKPKEAKKSANPNTPKNIELFTKFFIENDGKEDEDTKAVRIGASIDLEEVPYSGDVAYLHWENFDLAVSYKMESLLIFKIYQGAVKIGLSDGITPLFASFTTGILIPSNDKILVNMKNFLKSVMYSKDEILSLDFEIKYGNSEVNLADISAETAPILLNVNIPCKNLLIAKANKKDDDEKKTTSDESNGSSKADSNERTDFIGKVKNSIISFVSFHATTLFFHITYPNGEYCKPEFPPNYDLKINFDVILPMIEANVCSKDDIAAELKCFASAGISRPMKLSAKIIDGQVCKVESLILTQEAALYDDPTFKALNSYKYENNEIPVHVSVKKLADLVRFGEMVGDKRKQFLTVGPVDNATNVNKFIGVVISSVFEVEFKSEIKEKIIKPITIFYKPESAALIDIRASSEARNILQLLVNFKLPENSLFGIPTITSTENRFQWPAIRWGTFEYSFGVEKLFKLSLAVNRGQVDVHNDGIVISALNDFSVRIKLKTDESVNLGSTNLRLILGSIKKYFDPKNGEKNLIGSDFINDIHGHTFVYKFTMENPRELNEGIVFFSEGSVGMKEMLDVADTIINRLKLPDIEGAKTEQKVVLKDSNEIDLFKDLRVTIKTVDQERKSLLNLPCLIPALCKKDSLNQQDIYDVRSDEPMKLIFELENLLIPATELIGSKLGPILRNFKMADYPSSLIFSVALLSDVWVTMVLDGAGLATVGLSKETTMFSRSAIIDYGPNVTTFLQKESVKLVDKLDLPLLFRFPKTIIGLRKTLAVLRREAFLVPPVAPLFYVGADSGSIKRIPLTNAPLMICLSSDDRYAPGVDQNNLLSAVIAAALPETNVGSINAGVLLDMVKGEYVKPEDVKGKTAKKSDGNIESPLADAAVKKEDDIITEKGPFGYSGFFSLFKCLTSASWCNQIDLNYNIKLKYAVKLLRIILPNTSIFRLAIENSTFFQFVADSRKQKSFEVSVENGFDLLGTASINLRGLPLFNEGKDKTAADIIWDGKGEHKFEFNVIVGHDIDFKASLYFPSYLIKSYISSKAAVALANLNPMSYFYGKADKSKESENLIVPPVAGLLTLPNKTLEEFRTEMRECIDNNSDVDKLKRLKELDYSKSAIYFEKDNEEFSAHKETKIFLQLRTSNEEVVCGLPKVAKDLEIEFIRDENEQGFIKIVDFLSFKAPPELLVEKGKVTFNHAFNLFVVEVKLSYPGRYRIKVKNVKTFNDKTNDYFDGTTELKSAFLYVKNNY